MEEEEEEEEEEGEGEGEGEDEREGVSSEQFGGRMVACCRRAHGLGMRVKS